MLLSLTETKICTRIIKNAVTNLNRTFSPFLQPLLSLLPRCYAKNQHPQIFSTFSVAVAVFSFLCGMLAPKHLGTHRFSGNYRKRHCLHSSFWTMFISFSYQDNKYTKQLYMLFYLDHLMLQLISYNLMRTKNSSTPSPKLQLESLSLWLLQSLPHRTSYWLLCL